jgi:hypothetical protein
MRKQAKGRYSLYSMTDVPKLPEHMTRFGQVDVPSPMLIHAASSLRADLMMNPTEVTVLPLGRGPSGSVTREDQVLADNLEKSGAILWGRINDGREIDGETIWHQLVSPYGALITHCLGVETPDEPENEAEYKRAMSEWARTRFNWWVETPDPLTCCFPVGGMARTPAIAGRHYTQTVMETAKLYSGRRGEYRDAALRMDDYGKWDFVPVGDDSEVWESHWTSGKGIFETCEMLWLDDGDFIYHVALNKVPKGRKAGSGGGIIVSKTPNLTGGVSMTLVPGNPVPLRLPEDHFEPFLWPLMQTIKNINRIRSMRATTSQNITHPQSHIPLSPEVIKARGDAGVTGLPDPLTWEEGFSATPYTWGEAKAWPSGTDQDMDKLESSFWQEMPRYLPSTLELLDPQVLSQSTATAFLNVVESTIRRLGPMTALRDRGIAEVLKKVFYSIRHHYKDDYWYFAEGGERYGRGQSLERGAAFKIGPDDLDFPFTMRVTTHSMTQAQAHAQFQAWAEKFAAGIATRSEGIDAANYTDKQAQIKALAIDAAVEELTPWIDLNAKTAAVEEIKLESGILIPLEADPMMQQQAPQATAPNDGYTMNAPNVGQLVGGSNGGGAM